MTYYSSDSLDFSHDRLTLMGGLALARNSEKPHETRQ